MASVAGPDRVPGSGGALRRRRRAARCRRRCDPGRRERALLRLLVGVWARVGSDPVAAQLDDGPQASGVRLLERFGSGFRLLALDERAEVARAQVSDAGLVAALRRGERPPTWLVTGTDAAGVAAAAEALDGDRLAHRFALAVTPEGDLRLPDKGPDESPIAYSPHPGLLGCASALAASVYLGSIAVVAFACSNPIVLAGAAGRGRRRRARRRRRYRARRPRPAGRQPSAS